MEFYEELKWRGLVKDVTDEEGLRERLKTPATVYCGFDPTADSLHVGHFQQIMLLKRYQQAGHKVIALCGGFTGMIGDPRPTTERKLLTHEEVMHNAECIRAQLQKFLSFEGNNAAIMENNNNWLGDMTLLGFLRDYGKLFNVAYMLQKDTIKKRLDSGLSYTEFSYTILQAMDFLHLYQTYGCQIQIGGSDQWGNLTSGMELIRKIEGDQAKAWGVTSPLITRSDGTKFGKSEGKNVWLDPAKTSAYEFYQFWINTPDSDVVNFLKRLSMKTPEEIMALAEAVEKEPEQRRAQKALAEELTRIVHGEAGLASAQRITAALFTGDVRQLSPQEVQEAFRDAESTEVDAGINIVDALVAGHAASSKREAREFLNGHSIALNGEKVSDLDKTLTREDTLDGATAVIRRGKKNYFILKIR